MNRLDGILIRHKWSTTWWLAGAVFVALNILLRFSTNQPPVWDGAMSVFPAAIELSRTDFDFVRLFSLPTYYEGGPNTHATSPWTLVVAAVISATGSLANALPILHIISFGLAALTVAATYRLIAHSTPGIVAVLGALAVLLFPPMIVQAADIYLELPLTCLATWGLVMLLKRNFIASSAFITLAVWVKPLAVIFAAVLAGFVLIYGQPKRKVLKAAALAAPPLATAALVTVLQTAPSSGLPVLDRYVAAVGGSSEFLATMPDLVLVVTIALILTIGSIRQQSTQEAFRVMGLVLISVLTFVLVNPAISRGIPLLPRYYIAFFPALIAGILISLSLKSQRLALGIGFLLILTFVVNINGSFYRFKEHPIYFLAERSLAYRDLLALQMEDISILAELSTEMPVYYDYFGYYRLEYPELGYSEGPLATGVSVFHHPELAETSLADMPTRFGFAFEYPVLGGEVLLRIWDEAKASGARVTETTLTRGSFTVYVVEVDQSESPSP